MDKKNVFSTREWLLVIVIIVGVQFILHTLSYLYSGSSNALGYVSFAGTIVSILLGLIAIIYSFVQSISHGSSVRDVKDQALRLVEAGKDIVVSKEILSASASKLSEAADVLIYKIAENIDATNKVFGVVDKFSSNFGVELAGAKVESPVTSVKSVLNATRMWPRISMICLGVSLERGWSASKVRSDLISPLCDKLEMDKDIGFGIYIATIMCLEAEGFVEFSGADAITSIPMPNNGIKKEIETIRSTNIKSERREYLALEEILEALEE